MSPPPIRAILILFSNQDFLIRASNNAASYLGSLPIISKLSISSIPDIVGLNNQPLLSFFSVGKFDNADLLSVLETFSDLIKSRRATIDSKQAWPPTIDAISFDFKLLVILAII